MVSTCSCPKKGFFMEQDTSDCELSLTMTEASIWNNPSSSCVSSSERDGIFSPLASFHCTSGWGNHPLPVHFSLIPSSSGPTMKVWGPEPRPGEESHSSETWIFFWPRSPQYFTVRGVGGGDGQNIIVLSGRRGFLYFSHEVSEVQKLKEHWRWSWDFHQCPSELLYTSISAIGCRRVIGKELTEICQC